MRGTSRRSGVLSILAVTGLMAGLLVTAQAPPAAAASGVPTAAANSTVVTGPVVLPAIAPISIALTLPSFTIADGPLVATYTPSPTIGIHFRACRYALMSQNDLANDCFWLPSANQPNGFTEESATVAWANGRGTWGGGPGQQVTFSPRNLPFSGVGLYLAPFVRVYAISSVTGQSPAGMNTEFGPSAGTTLAQITWANPGSAVTAAPTVSLSSSVARPADSITVTVVRPPISFAGATGPDLTASDASAVVGLAACTKGVVPTGIESARIVTGTNQVNSNAQVPIQSAAGCRIIDIPNNALQLVKGASSVPAASVPLTVTGADLAGVPVAPGQSVQLDLFGIADGLLSQSAGVAVAMWGANRISAPVSVTIAEPDVSHNPSNNPGGGGSTPGPSGGGSNSAGNPASVSAAQQAATAAGVDLSLAPIAGTNGKGTAAGRTLRVTAPKTQKAGHKATMQARLTPTAPGTMRFVLVGGAAGSLTAVRSATAAVRKGKAKASWRLPRSTAKGQYTLVVTYLPASGAGITVTQPLRVR